MIKWILFIIYTCINLQCTAQVTQGLIQTSEIYKKELNGNFLAPDSNLIKIDTFFTKERMYNYFVYHYKNGEKKNVILYKSGKYREVLYRDSLLRRTKQYGWDSLGNKIYNVHYINDIEANGFHWNSDGTISSNYATVGDTCFNNVFYPSGHLEHQTKYIKGKHFVTILYCENGNIISIDYSGYKDFQLKIYHCNGPLRVVSYKDSSGHFYGKYKRFYENGKLEVVGRYTSKSVNKNGHTINFAINAEYGGIGMKDGMWKYYNDKGNLIRIEKYRRGKRIRSIKVRE